MKTFQSAIIIVSAFLIYTSSDFVTAQEKSSKEDSVKTYSYAKNIAPIVKTYCLSCHGSDNENPSDLYMDDYATMMKGGKHGVPVIPGKPDESNLYLKLSAHPPFGKQMPRGHKKITPEAVKMIHDWIEQGAQAK